MVTEPLRGHLATLVSRFAQSVGGEHLGFETLDNATYRAAVKNVFNQDVLPDFDLANTRFLLSFGAVSSPLGFSHPLEHRLRRVS